MGYSVYRHSGPGLILDPAPELVSRDLRRYSGADTFPVVIRRVFTECWEQAE